MRTWVAVCGLFFAVAAGWTFAETSPSSVPKATAVSPLQGEEFIGHRFCEKDGYGWGWVKRPGQSWDQAVWVALFEQPGRLVAPHRKLGRRDADQDWEYRMRGYFADFQVYDPRRDELLDVFVPQSIEPIGKAPPLNRPPGPPSRRKGRTASRPFSR
ncbi:hypothetical protein [Candidatus Methylacidithermus pantelleriae]|nr:hypothetical protein [Candidatus Methylacidithermus pantelleriae]